MNDLLQRALITRIEHLEELSAAAVRSLAKIHMAVFPEISRGEEIETAESAAQLADVITRELDRRGITKPFERIDH